MATQNLMQGGDTCRWDQAGSSRSERELVALHSVVLLRELRPYTSAVRCWSWAQWRSRRVPQPLGSII